MTLKGTYIKNGYVCNHKECKHICLKCGKEYTSYKLNQKYCSKSCSASVTIGLNQSMNKRIDDVSIFKNGVDNEINAYILGLIWSDGSISCDKINISMNDKELMEQVHRLMTPNKKLYRNGKSYSVISSNEEDLKYLKSTGMTTNKSYDARLPILNESLMPHLIRGWFDGDGCIYKSTTTNPKRGYKKTYFRVSFTTGSYQFAEDINKFLISVGIESNINKDCRKNVWYVQINKIEAIIKFKNYIYKNTTIYLDRKHDKFNEIV